jgi:hypothetical protein
MGQVTVLRPYLEFDRRETLLSFASRLGAFHTGAGMERILKDLGISVQSFTSGRTGEIDALAAVAGTDAAELHQNAIAVHQTYVLFQDQKLSKAFLTPRAARYCPVCLEEDGCPEAWRHRLLWGFRNTLRCPTHGIRLVASADKLSVNLRETVGASDLGARLVAEDTAPEYLTWLTHRLEGGQDAECDWLKGQTLEQVLAASEMLGAVLEHGHRVRIRKLSATDSERATDIGFSIYREGREAVDEALDTIRQTSPASAVQAGPLAHYGALFDWLDRRCNAIDPGPIRSILRDHIIKHSAVESGEKILGEEVSVRKFHTLKSLSAETGIERRRMSRLLQKLGEVPAGATDAESGNLVFETEKILPLIEAFHSAVPLQEVPEFIGASKQQTERLYRGGILKPLIPASGPGSVRRVVFARADLDTFLEKLEQLPPADSHELPGFQPIAYACQRGAGPFEEVFAKVMDGSLPSCRSPGKTGISKIRVDLGSALS